MESHITQSGLALDHFIRLGGFIHESALPMDALVSFRLINQDFIKPFMDTEEGRFYEVTKKGITEAEKILKQTGN